MVSSYMDAKHVMNTILFYLIMGKFIDLSGQRSGRLLVIKRIKNRNKSTVWECVCDCGNTTNVHASRLRNGLTESCGCLRIERLKAKCIKHGQNHSKLHQVWVCMKQRCNNPNATQYKDYGGRAIKVCDQWTNDYTAFRNWSILNGYKEGLTIDRINNNKGYSPDNCRWVSRFVQNRNKRNTIHISYNNKTQTLKEWANEIGVPFTTLYNRVRTGMPIEKVMTPHRILIQKRNNKQ